MSELRISGGELSGRRIRVPRGDVRPTTERVREAVFSMLGDITGARVLDLFCGSGALAIEALSRGAGEATLVDKAPQTARENLRSLDLEERAATVRSDAARYMRRAEETCFDLILCDPPYRLADRLAREFDPLIRRVLVPGGRAMIESSPDRPLELGLPLVTERRYGDTLVRIHGGAE